MSVAAKRYAKALVDALPVDQAEQAFDQLSHLSALLAEHEDARLLFQNPTVSSDRRKLFLSQISAALSFAAPVRNFIQILVERNRLDLLDEILRDYRGFLDDKSGIIRATVTTAQELDASQQKDLADKFEKMTGKKVRMDVSVDPAILGGVVARVGSTIYDGSLRQKLKSFRARLVQE